MFPEEKYMQRCLQLAAYGKGQVAPNPMVGAVIVRDGKIIGEGFHRRYGEAHAEVNAIASVSNKSLLRESTLYVNLEPCSHYGKTPPCSKLIIENQIPRVVIGHSDPYPKVSGRGIQMLREAGIEVICDFLRPECEDLNKRFLTFHQKGRPYILLKWAQSADGFMDKIRQPGDGQQAVRFSDFFTQTAVHKLRSEEAAIMVGTRTALLDNPSLNVRLWAGKNPLRITIDKDLKIPPSSHLLDGTSPTLIFTDMKNQVETDIYCKINFNTDILPQMMQELLQRKIQSLIVEGGANLLQSFICSDLWDEAHIEIAEIKLKEGIQIPNFQGKLENVQKCENSMISVYKNTFSPKNL